MAALQDVLDDPQMSIFVSSHSFIYVSVRTTAQELNIYWQTVSEIEFRCRQGRRHSVQSS